MKGRLLHSVVMSGLLAVLTVAGATRAADDLGLFFDTAGTLDAWTTTAPDEAVTVHLVLLDPSEPSGVGGWECQVLMEGEGALPVIGWTLSGTAINIETPPAFRVGLATPLPWSEAVVLATGQLLVADPDTGLDFYVQPLYVSSLPGAPCYAAGDDPTTLIPLAPASGCGFLPVARINPGPGDPGIDLTATPAELIFPELTVGDIEVEVLELTNESLHAITGSATIAGTGFLIALGSAWSTTAPFEIPAGDALDLFVRFEPTAAGSYADTVAIAVCDLAVLAVPVSGSAGVPVCEIEPDSLDFGEVEVGDEVIRSFVIRNTGGGRMSCVLESECGPAFDYGDIPPYSSFELGPGEERAVNLAFRPPTAIEYDCVLHPAVDQACGLVVHGVGLSNLPICEVEPTDIHFGPVRIGESRDEMFLISNVGAGTVHTTIDQPGGQFGIVSGAGYVAIPAGEGHEVTVRYTPTLLGPTSRTVNLTGGCDDVQLTGFGYDSETDCDVWPETADFGEVVAGTVAERIVRVVNVGTDVLHIDASLDALPFSIVSGGGAHDLEPLEIREIRIALDASTVGSYSATLLLGAPECGDVPCIAEVYEPEDHATVGFYFDPSATYNRLETTHPGQVVEAYMLMTTVPDSADVSCFVLIVDIVGPHTVLAWEIPRPHVNVTPPPDFVVHFDTPLPWQPVMHLLTAQLFIPTYDSVNLLYIHGHYDLPEYCVGSGGVRQMWPVNWGTGDPTAWINEGGGIIGVAAPAPAVAAADGGVVLTATLEPPADGCHVYRRAADEPVAERLTATPLRPGGGRVVFKDDGRGVRPGTEVLYSYALLAGDREIARSPEVAIRLAGAVPAAHALEQCWPNPFNAAVNAEFALARPCRARLSVHDLAGRLVRTLLDLDLREGTHVRQWDGRDERGRLVPSGPYYIRLEAQGHVAMQRVTLLK